MMRASRGKPSRGNWQRWLGVAFSIVGLGLVVLACWQRWGTTWVARPQQAHIVEQLEKRWAADAPGAPTGTETDPVPDSDPDSAPENPVRVRGTTAGAILRIPAFGPDYAMPILEGTSSDILAVGVGHVSDSAPAGAVGNFALAAHRVTHGEPFRHLPDLRVGDQIIIDTARWRYIYALDTDGDALEVSHRDTWVTDPEPVNPTGGPAPAQRTGQRLITLTTCAELFRTDNRLVAFGHLVQRTGR